MSIDQSKTVAVIFMIIMNNICMYMQKQGSTSTLSFPIQPILLQSKKIAMAVLLGYQDVRVYIWLYKLPVGQRDVMTQLDLVGGLLA